MLETQLAVIEEKPSPRRKKYAPWGGLFSLCCRLEKCLLNLHFIESIQMQNPVSNCLQD